jgi:hypothetical protein
VKIIEAATTPQGTHIQIEDWRDNYTDTIGFMVAAYPILQSNFVHAKYSKPGEKIRVTVAHKRSDFIKYQSYAYEIFCALKSGEKTLGDYLLYHNVRIPAELLDPWY